MYHPDIIADDQGPPLALLCVSRDVAAFERIANDPSVLPHVALTDHVDLSATLADERNIGFIGQDCAFIAHWLEPGVYEVHSMALPSARGRVVLASAMAAIRTMFIATPAMELLTRVNDGNVAAYALTRKVGFVEEFHRAAVWGDKGARFFAMRYPEWIKSQAWLGEVGHWFHDMLGEEVEHAEDPAHDLYVGAAVEMARAGQPDKAVTLYNRWARFAGYATVEIVDREPLTIDIRSHLIRLNNGNIEVVACL